MTTSIPVNPYSVRRDAVRAAALMTDTPRPAERVVRDARVIEKYLLEVFDVDAVVRELAHRPDVREAARRAVGEHREALAELAKDD